MCTSPLLRIERADGKVYIEGAESGDRYQKALIEYSKGNKVALKPWAMYRRVNNIPCGHCMECRISKSKEWANRIMFEAEQWEENYFITLTYDDNHLPYRDWFYDADGCVQEGACLDKTELQNFMKKLRTYNDRKFRPIAEDTVLRKHFHCLNKDGLNEGETTKFENLVSEEMKKYQIRFYACGEYGEKYGRPHFHLILFNMHLDDLVLFKKTENGAYFLSETITKAWSENGVPKGHVLVANLCYETGRYVAQYVLKKQYGENSQAWYNMMRRTPEFTLMSRNPGIGRDYYEKNKEQIYKNDGINIPKKDGSIKVKPPKYYDKLFELEDKETLDSIKRLRNKKVVLAEEHRQIQSNATPEQRRKMRENHANNKNKLLQRSNIV